MAEFIPLWLFAGVCVCLLFGYPVAFSLGGTALIFAAVGSMFGTFDSVFLEALPNRLFGIVGNETLIAVPLFVLMGVLLEKSKLAEKLLDSMAMLFGTLRGGLGISVILVGMLLAASTGIVGATVVTMGMISLPTMLRRGYDPALAAGTICATGTLGQIIPPSIALVLLGDVMSNAYQKAQLEMGIFSPKTISVGDLFVGALIPGLILVGLYILYVIMVAWLQPHKAPAVPREELRNGSNESLAVQLFKGLVPPLVLIFAVLGSILSGIATPTEAAGVGALGAALLALGSGKLNLPTLKDAVYSTAKVTCMVFMILIGASLFSLVFRGFGGEELIQDFFSQLPGGVVGAMIVVMLLMFFLGFILDFIEITFVVVPIVAPVLLAMGLDPVWLGIMMAINLQTSFLTPPFGFALFYLRGVAPPELKTQSIYKGVIPFILIQVSVLIMLSIWPDLATWLPEQVYAD
ncbi:MAG: TRAP transporter large permease subunit [Gammaproteobacteria bacterium]|uniref:TRAP transporter large permease protein n=1 Tax=Marinomonas polaris DSM 16579 TaxID=1122206 RepID=A0A1M5B091_9GAMM|nr:TRAP transporter large permease subunit [Marinomonas polaris]MBU1467833.1 TRAP transporter large permease subunit [Gammaproteobacteria bacterium]MBU2321111.1 TRAP transporter large permease subunit [Gammaproteobacteria bacterium]MBU2413625.1 TRAP transporter large permease subunit [Gammaproteobacteria bacterium]SHF35873.1 TRAP transporter, DctM subunit [Marinomonas polaris DSM 16579]|tara:strand:- start:2467 stop:3855 length:1389 start_codon:yes stop_codon:yes gene_type:complete